MLCNQVATLSVVVTQTNLIQSSEWILGYLQRSKRLDTTFSEFPAGVFIHPMLYGSANAVIRYKNKTTLFAPTVTEIDMVDSRSIHVIHRFVLFICKHHVRNVSIT